MWQTIAVALIGIAVIAYVGYKVWRFLTKPPTENPCEHCAGCPLNNKEKCNVK